MWYAVYILFIEYIDKEKTILNNVQNYVQNSHVDVLYLYYTLGINAPHKRKLVGRTFKI